MGRALGTRVELLPLLAPEAGRLVGERRLQRRLQITATCARGENGSTDRSARLMVFKGFEKSLDGVPWCLA